MFGDKKGDSRGLSLLIKFKNGVARKYRPILLFLLLTGILCYVGYVFATANFVYPLTSPANNSWSTSASVAFTCNISISGDNTSIANVSIYSNMTGAGWFYNASNSSAVTANSTVSITVNPIPNGHYNWSCGVWELNSSGGGTATETVNTTDGMRVLKVDTTAPVLYNITPSNISGVNGFINAASAAFRVSVIDYNNVTGNVTVYYRRKGSAWDFDNKKITLNCNRNSTTQYWNCSKTGQDLRAEVSENQVLEFFFNATDEAGNGGTNGSSATYYYNATVDSNAPVINWFNATGYHQTGNWSNSNSIKFYVNITDNNTVNNASCRVFYNGTVDVTGSSGNNTGLGTNISNVTISYYISDVMSASATQIFADGSYTWNVTCNDSAGNSANTLNNITLNVDATAPSFTALGPTNNTWNASRTVNFSFAVTENNLFNCYLWTNETAWGPRNNNTKTQLDSGKNFTYTFSADGSYLWNVECNDSAGNSAFNATNYTINVDATAPTINRFNATGYAQTGNWSNSNSIKFYVNATDANTGNNAACRVFYNGTAGASGNNSLTNVSNVTLSYTSNALSASATQIFADGSYTWNVTCNDSAGNSANTLNNITLNVDATAPSFTALGPTNNTWNASRTLTSSFGITEKNLAWCNLWNNMTAWSLKNSSYNLTSSGSSYNFSYTFSADGSYLWNVECNDSAGNSAFNATNYTINVDATVPIIVVAAPLNNTYINSGSSILFNVSVIERNINSAINITLYQKPAGIYIPIRTTCTDLTATGGTYTHYCNVTVTNASLGDTETILFFFNTSDLASNVVSNGSEAAPLIATVDSSAPTITTVNQTGYTTVNNFSNTNNIIFYVNASDPRATNCTIYYNASATGWTANVTFTYTSNDLTASPTQRFADGSYRYNITCNDTVGNSKSLASNITFNVDGTAPAVSFINATGYKAGTYPEQNWSNTKSIIFYYTTTDNNGDTCILFTNMTGSWIANLSAGGTINTTWASGTTASVNVTFTTDGSYLWNIRCNDTANNSAFYANNMTVNIDSSAPTINWVNQSGYNKGTNLQNWSNTNDIIFYVNATDSNTINCTILYNASATGFTLNTTFAYTSNGMSASAAQSFADKSYRYNVTCNDSAGNAVNYGSNITFNVDATAPSIKFMNATGYNNNNVSNSRTVLFQFNMSEANIDTCSLFTNMTGAWLVNTSAVNTSANMEKNLALPMVNGSVNITFTNDGSYLWNIRCNDSSNNFGFYSSNLTVNVDSVAPTVNWLNSTGYWKGTVPSQNWSRSSSVTFYVNVTERDPSYCVVYWNATLGNTTFSYSDNAMSASSAITFSDGSYTLNVSCNDTAGRWGSYGNITFNVDATAPTLNWANQTGYHKTSNWTDLNITFYVNATDLNPVNCTLYYNRTATGWTLNTTFAYTTNSMSNSAEQVFADGSYRYNVTCNDSAGNAVGYGVNVTFHVDSGDPAVNWINATGYNKGAYPEQNWSNSNTIYFYVNATDNNPDKCHIYYNASTTGSVNFSYTTNAMTASAAQTLSDRSYAINVTCNDSAGNIGYLSKNITINVDATAPNLTWANQTGFVKLGNWTNKNITFYVLTNDTNPVNCTLYYNRTATGWTLNTTFAYTTNSMSNSAEQVFAGGSYRYNVTCNDSAGNAMSLGTNVTFNIDVTAPTINLINASGKNNNWSSSRTITFYTNATETGIGPDTCVLFTNMTGNLIANNSAGTLNTSWASNVVSYMNLTFSADNHILWNVSCNDSVGNINYYAANYTVKIDTVAPAINLSYPANNSWVAGADNATFNYTVNDNGISICRIFTNMTGSGTWAANTTAANASLANGVMSGFTINFTVDSHFLWNIECDDLAGNRAVNGTNFTVKVDDTVPTLSSAEYYIPERKLNLTFSETMDASTITLTKVNFTFSTSDTTNAEFHSDGLSGATASGTDTTLIQINLTEAQHSALATMVADSPNKYVNLSLIAAAITDSAGNNIVATKAKLKYNSGFVNSTQTLTQGWKTLNIPPTSIMAGFEQPYSASSTQNWNISVMLQSLGNNYNVVYYNIYNNASGWKVFTRGNWSTSTLQYVNNSNDLPYWINTTAANRWEI